MNGGFSRWEKLLITGGSYITYVDTRGLGCRSSESAIIYVKGQHVRVNMVYKSKSSFRLCKLVSRCLFLGCAIPEIMANTLQETASVKIPQLFPDAVYEKLVPAPDHPLFNYKGFEPGKTILKKGHVRSEGYRPFPQDVIYDRDMMIQVRDGAKLYADLFRPVDSDKNPVPVIIPWSPYGKTGTGPMNYDTMAPYRVGIPKDRTSGYEKFEACPLLRHANPTIC